MFTYQHREIEKKWQDAWQRNQVFATPPLQPADKKAYILDFFPYPSGAGLHVGHLLGYTGSDIISRVARMQGKKVLHPMGWDAFGLPAENYAIKHGVHPKESTAKNSAEFKRQFQQAGISYDWGKEMNTSDPEYYKWTQWMFGLLYKRGLAYRKEGLVNWCPSCQTVLANEQVVNGTCERCGTTVLQKKLKQWYFKITDYAERLLNDLDLLDWPERIKQMQRNWIGRSEGAQLYFPLVKHQQSIEVFTTRPDTVFGATYIVLAPEHELVDLLTTPEQAQEVKFYQKETSEKTELERSFTDKEKTGVFTGSYAFNPATQQPIPIWIADYVIASYGTGAIMAVPAHDERDYIFAKHYNLPITTVIEHGEEPLPYTQKGQLINSGKFTGKSSEEVWDELINSIGGKKQITYRIRDWLVSRQRFWGAPIPIVYDENGEEELLPVEDLPVLLPENAEFLPTGQSPLARSKEWQNYQGKKQEVDTLDGFVCSSWYFLRFPTPHYSQAAFNKEEVEKWLPVDVYIGGAEHAVLHLLYARFLTKVLQDAGYLNFFEPFSALRNQGIILGPDHNKMSKSKGNVINPDEVIAEYGADTLRVYEMFMGPFELEKPWSTQGMVGIRRFLEKVWKLAGKVQDVAANEMELTHLHRAIKKVTSDVAAFKFNTSVSSMMEAVNYFSEQPSIAKSTYTQLLQILNPFAPHITEELWEQQGMQGFCSLSSWPPYEEKYLQEKTILYPVQINGKVRVKLLLPADLTQDALLTATKADSSVQKWLEGKRVVREVVIVGRMISLVTD